MKIAYGELIGGVSGDMFVAALIDVGLPLDKLRVELRKIPSLEFDLKASKKHVHAIRAARFQVISRKNEPARSWKQIRDLIARSKLDSRIKATGLEIFASLAEAEAKVHGIAVDNVHFHEVGATDSIIDIMAAAIGIHDLDIDVFYFSRIPLGHSVTRSRHGPQPVPGPATLELLKGLPVFGVEIEAETVTPTGAALVRALGKSFGPSPPMRIEKIGYGTGQKEFADRPNLFRLTLGAVARELTDEEMLLVETNIDDMNPQLYDYVMERLFDAGARDVFLSPIQMKKNRPATLLSVICDPSDRDAIANILLQETTTIGVRYQPIARLVLQRKTEKVKTRFGEVTVKLIVRPDGTRRAVPEYDDLKRIAALKKLPLKLVHDEVSRLLETS